MFKTHILISVGIEHITVGLGTLGLLDNQRPPTSKESIELRLFFSMCSVLSVGTLAYPAFILLLYQASIIWLPVGNNFSINKSWFYDATLSKILVQ